MSQLRRGLKRSWSRLHRTNSGGTSIADSSDASSKSVKFESTLITWPFKKPRDSVIKQNQGSGSTASSPFDLEDTYSDTSGFTPLQSSRSVSAEIVVLVEFHKPTSPSFLDLPQEIQDLIYEHYFRGEKISVRAKRCGQHPVITRLIIDADCVSTIFLLCRRTYAAAKHFLRLAETSLDIQSYKQFIFMDRIFRGVPQMMNTCTKLSICRDQVDFAQQSNILTQLDQLPQLKSLDVYDYKSCKRYINFELGYGAELFEIYVPMRLSPYAANDLNNVQAIVEPRVSVNVYYICDTLVCLPEDKGSKTTDDTIVGKLRCRSRYRRMVSQPCSTPSIYRVADHISTATHLCFQRTESARQVREQRLGIRRSVPNPGLFRQFHGGPFAQVLPGATQKRQDRFSILCDLIAVGDSSYIMDTQQISRKENETNVLFNETVLRGSGLLIMPLFDHTISGDG